MRASHDSGENALRAVVDVGLVKQIVLNRRLAALSARLCLLDKVPHYARLYTKKAAIDRAFLVAVATSHAQADGLSSFGHRRI